MNNDIHCNVTELLGKTLVSVVNESNDKLIFTTIDGDVYVMLHDQQCRENVYLEDIVGDLDDLVGSPILISEECDGESPSVNYIPESFTWTFYKFATIKGYVDLRWYGESNGYYSEGVDFYKLGK